MRWIGWLRTGVQAESQRHKTKEADSKIAVCCSDIMYYVVVPTHRGGTDFAFFDHRGTRFHSDMVHLQRTEALRGRILADNTLKPGAPEFLWLLCKAGI